MGFQFSKDLIVLLKYWEQEKRTKNKLNLRIAQ